MSRTSSGRKKFEGRMRKLEKEEQRKKEEQKKLDAIEDAKWKIGAKNTAKEDALREKRLQAEALKRERELEYDKEYKRSGN
jgi:hypothetical protein